MAMGRRGQGAAAGGGGAQYAYPVLAAAPRRMSATVFRGARSRCGALLQGLTVTAVHVLRTSRTEVLARTTCAPRVRLRFARATFHACKCPRSARPRARAVRWMCPCILSSTCHGWPRPRSPTSYRAASARQRRRHRGGAPARTLCWRCACLRCRTCVAHARVACTRYVCACCACLRFCALAFPMLALCAPAVRALAMRARAVCLRVVCGVLVQRSPTSCGAR